MKGRPSIARAGLAGIPRPAPRVAPWTALDLARRRSLTRALDEAEAAESRGDPAHLVLGWRAVAAGLERLLERRS